MGGDLGDLFVLFCCLGMRIPAVALKAVRLVEQAPWARAASEFAMFWNSRPISAPLPGGNLVQFEEGSVYKAENKCGGMR
jgi:hypothetical protein